MAAIWPDDTVLGRAGVRMEENGVTCGMMPDSVLLLNIMFLVLSPRSELAIPVNRQAT